MTTPALRPPAYKDVTLQQLRSLCATARHGSLTGAAAALGLAQPTVWKQVHSLEQKFGVQLIDTHPRGCGLTEAGKVLLDLVAPNVANLDELQGRLDEALNKVEIHITLAAPPRQLAEELLPGVADFVARWPRVRLTLLETMMDELPAAIAAGHADLGFTTNVDHDSQFSQLSVEPSHEVDVLLLTPADHPLAGRRRVRPEDLKAYPLVNAWNTLRDPQVHATVVKLGLFQTQPRLVEARQSLVIRRYVEQGLGIALVSGLPSSEPNPRLHERVMSRYFGRSRVYLVRPAGVYQHPAIRDLAETVRSQVALRNEDQRSRRAPQRGRT